MSELINEDYDVYSLLFYLNYKSGVEGVRDYLVHKLYRVADEDLEAILPQLCHLFMVWSPHASGPLGDFLSHLCASSIHFTLKLIWTFRAQQFHCTSREQNESMDRLVLSMEMSLINGSVLQNDGTMRRKKSNTTRGAARREHEHEQQRQQRSSLNVDTAVPASSSPAAGGLYQQQQQQQHWQRSSRESSRDSSPGGFGASSSFSSTSSSSSRSRSLTPQGRRSKHMPPPPSFALPLNSNGAAAPSSSSSSSGSGGDPAPSSPEGVVFRPAPETPVPSAATEADQAAGSAVPAHDQRSQTASQLARHPISGLTQQGPGPEGATSTSASYSSTTVTQSTSFTVLSQSPSPDPSTAAAAAPSISIAPPPAPAAAASSSVLDDASSSSPTSAGDDDGLEALHPTPLSQSPSSFACCASHAALIDELYLVYSKHVRSEYFNGIQRMMDSFGRVSTALVKLPQASRNKKLRQAMREMDSAARGLYFPTLERNNRHYRILRFLPEDTFVLNSRDKAPFLFHFEIAVSSAITHSHPGQAQANAKVQCKWTLTFSCACFFGFVFFAHSLLQSLSTLPPVSTTRTCTWPTSLARRSWARPCG